MPSFNKIIFGGHLTGDPVVKPLGNSNLASFSLANNRRRTDASGNVKEEVCFLEVEAWGKQADVCAKYLHKGEPVLIEGRLKQSTWEDKNGGGKRSKHVLLCEDIVLMTPPTKQPDSAAPARRESQTFTNSAHSQPKSKIDMIRDAGFDIKRIDSRPVTPKEDIEDLPF